MEHLLIWQAVLNVYEHFITAMFFFFNHTMVEIAANIVEDYSPENKLKLALQYIYMHAS